MSDYISRDKLEEMYGKMLNVAYDTADEYPRYKGIMLYEAQKIIDVVKEYLLSEEGLVHEWKII